SFLQYPRNVIVSPSFINERVEPSLRVIGLSPFQVSSSIEPHESALGPVIVPLPIMSPLFTLQPFAVWWANCCAIFQYIYLKLLFVIVTGSPSLGVRSTSR